MQFLVQHDNQRAPRNVLWGTQLQIQQPSSCTNQLCESPSNWISSSNVKLRLAKDTLVVGPFLGDNASARSVGGELSAGHNDHYGDRRACRNARHVHDSGT